MRLDATISLRFDIALFWWFRAFRFLQLFWLSNIPSSYGSYLTFLLPNLYRPTFVAYYALSKPPEPLSTSVLCGRCRLYRCRQILTFGEEILALCSSATSQHLLLPTTTNAADVMQLPTIDGMQDMGCDMDCDIVCAMRYAIDSAMSDEGIAFFVFLWACCHDIAAR